MVSGCIALVLNENVSESSHSVPRFDTPAFPKEFSRAVIKLVGRYLLAIRVNQEGFIRRDSDCFLFIESTEFRSIDGR